MAMTESKFMKAKQIQQELFSYCQLPLPCYNGKHGTSINIQPLIKHGP